ncbi:MAG: TetR/AcrR family transcriptional regulator [Rhodospirillaceae bacterium]|jgi:AcrR family transcriptional regulator|nr:TetR/AcrR family transcriptional regulator [Rhodospirillaceae bacterium]
MKKRAPEKPARRGTYRHGDLRRALLEAGVALAREGGPEAIVLREATRRAGVVPNAAYRHFASRDDLLQAVRSAALAELARAIEAELAKTRRAKTLEEDARGALRAVGRAYLRFALGESGLFRTAFATPEDLGLGPNPARSGQSGLNPFELLGSALDKFVSAGLLPPERRPGAEFLAWSAVHGFAMLILDGPLRPVPRAQLDAIGERVIAMVEKGL